MGCIAEPFVVPSDNKGGGAATADFGTWPGVRGNPEAEATEEVAAAGEPRGNTRTMAGAADIALRACVNRDRTNS